MKTPGQERAVRELERLNAANPDGFEIQGSPVEVDGSLIAKISLRLGLMETSEGGLELREREDFILWIPPDFPFEYPSLTVAHNRFANFPHVVWSKALCLYQSKIEWNPSDGLYGFFDRLKLWLGKAAINDMDPIEGPLEPPHHVTDFSQVPFVIRANAPVQAGKSWLGLAELKKCKNRIELTGWNDLTGSWPASCVPALACILPKSLPMEFPKKGEDFFNELVKQGIDRDRILRDMALAALFAPKGEPIHFIIGMPMRRAADGTPKLHIAIWSTDSEFSESLRNTISEEGDSEKLRSLRKGLADALYALFSVSTIKWCRVMEDRSEIVSRRDKRSPVAWLSGKRILILGCGALGSWVGEIVARACPCEIDLVDNSIVKPGLLARQNYRLEDIGSNKAVALAERLGSIAQGTIIQNFNAEAHRFITEEVDRFGRYDLVLDCTASGIFQMKLERDWGTFGGRTPLLVSMIIDAKAECCLGVVLRPNSGGGIWNAFVQLKLKLCLSTNRKDIVSAFYSEQSYKDMFQPEPGCSDPTFSGSTADVTSLSATALNLALSHHPSGNSPVGFAFSGHGKNGRGTLDVIKLPEGEMVSAGGYSIRIAKTVYRDAKAWIRQNNRVRSRQHETGGVLWGLWDDAVRVIWIFDLSGPPPDSLHNPGHFVCGVEGTGEEHQRRFKNSHGACGFIGFWHTHPDMESVQSGTDIRGMAELVAKMGQNQKRALMLIFGRTAGQPTAGIYVYESHSVTQSSDFISVGQAQIALESAVV